MSTRIAERTQAPPSRRWIADQAHTTVEFDAKSFWGLTTVHGRFTRCEGWYDDGPDGGKIVLEIDAESVETGNATRDRHLRSAEFLNADRHATIRFTSSAVPAADGTLHLTGALAAAGTSVPLTLDATMLEREGELQIEARPRVDHRAFGMGSGPLGMIRGPVDVHVMASLR
jgi:polyisoprenoid-binding protein YceI